MRRWWHTSVCATWAHLCNQAWIHKAIRSFRCYSPLFQWRLFWHAFVICSSLPSSAFTSPIRFRQETSRRKREIMCDCWLFTTERRERSVFMCGYSQECSSCLSEEHLDAHCEFYRPSTAWKDAYEWIEISYSRIDAAYDGTCDRKGSRSSSSSFKPRRRNRLVDNQIERSLGSIRGFHHWNLTAKLPSHSAPLMWSRCYLYLARRKRR